jgi:hypothetical protein
MTPLTVAYFDMVSRIFEWYKGIASLREGSKGGKKSVRFRIKSRRHEITTFLAPGAQQRQKATTSDLDGYKQCASYLPLAELPCDICNSKGARASARYDMKTKRSPSKFQAVNHRPPLNLDVLPLNLNQTCFVF